MNLPTAQQFCKGQSEGPDGKKCTTEWRRIHFDTHHVPYKTWMAFFAIWHRHANDLGIPQSQFTVLTRNDHPDTTYAQLASAFARTVREMEVAR